MPHFFGGALIFVGAAIEAVLHAFAAWAPTMPEEVTTSVALLRLPPIDDVPPPLRGVVSLALRFGFTGSPERGEALLAPMRAVATPLLDSVGPMSYAAVDRIHMDPTEPMPAVARGGLLHSMPERSASTPCSRWPAPTSRSRWPRSRCGSWVERSAVPRAVPNAVAGRDGAYSLSVVAPAPPPLAGHRPCGDSRGTGRPGAVVDRHVAGQLRRTRRASRATAHGRRTCSSGCAG